MNNLIAVSIGDLNGIGIEILFKIWKKKTNNNFVLFTNYKIISNLIKKKKLSIKLNRVNTYHNYIKFKKNYLNIFDYNATSHVENTYKSIIYAHKETTDNNFIGLLTLPLRKDLIIKKIDKSFIGHTEFLQRLENKKYSNMILYNKKIIVSPLTTHIKLNDITKQIGKNNYIYKQILNLNRTLECEFNIQKPKLLISGLNPHAGENGAIGNEEITILKPILRKLRKNKINISGPVSGDSMLLNDNMKIFDCFVFIYHDQALIPFKYISKFTGVNFTGNLKIIRVSPDHGTAYNLVGKKTASDKSIQNCFKFIKIINKNKKKYEKTKKIIKSKLFK